MSVSANADNPLVVTNRNNEEILAYRFPDLQYSPMGMFIIYRMIRDRDVKGLVTQSGNQTGGGKTMLAVKLSKICASWCKQIFQRENYHWSSKEYSFMDVYGYLDKYENAYSGDVFITDELETMVDKRRSLKHENVDFSHYWQELRYKNCITWATAPGIHNLDKRVKENTDIWINVTMQGRANIYLLKMNDFIEQLNHKRFKKGHFRQSLLWLPSPNDEDYLYLKRLKNEKDRGKKLREKTDSKNEYKEITDTMLLNILELNDSMNLGLTQEDIANKILEGKRSQQYISKVKREQNS